MNLAHWLHQTARARPTRPAILLGEVLHATYEEFAAQSCAIGQHLATHYNIQKGDRVALFTRNCAEYLEILYGVLWIGAVIVPINHKLHPREAAWIIKNAKASLAVTETGAEFGDEVPLPCPELGLDAFRTLPRDRYQPPQPVEPEDVAWLFYTSGTTGRPKGVMITHKNIHAMVGSYTLDVDQVFPDDVSLYAAPMSHGAGLYNFQFVRAGACHLIPPSQGFDPAEIATLGQRFGNLVFFAAPTMIKRLVEHAKAEGYDGTGNRTIIYGGGPMYLADIDQALDVLGPKFVQIYGQGESPMTITALPRDLVADRTHPDAKARRMSVGFAQSCVSLRVVDEAMNDLPCGETGEIILRGDSVMAGYWDNEEATRKTLHEGWLKTGDMGRLDDDGFLTLTDRSKDVIISGGSNIYPREVEEVLLGHPDVFEVSVVGATDDEWGEIVVAFIVFEHGKNRDTEELDQWCKAQIASFKKPKRYEIVNALPKNSYGKVLKTELRQRL
ncbi:class I adenylate-forming enzyme family protein [Neptunicoccus cionae]|uniref:3-methylmercaptopropionyl-CoA ligase n=1 Tax=Neptunicoccus cionae TaxID=2035344 RepID=A0A916R1G2_9RHOB|nr:AMP-binding protein [Amylibacter cionae]GGA26788.1 AMP-dependent synthetase [Amylibacter cionae]